MVKKLTINVIKKESKPAATLNVPVILYAKYEKKIVCKIAVIQLNARLRDGVFNLFMYCIPKSKMQIKINISTKRLIFYKLAQTNYEYLIKLLINSINSNLNKIDHRLCYLIN